MALTKSQREVRAKNEAVLADNFPHVDAAKLQNDLFRLALKCQRNAVGLCNDADHADQRQQLRAEFARICKKHGIELRADMTGDPRGFALKLHLPNGQYNTWGGKESGYGIGKE